MHLFYVVYSIKQYTHINTRIQKYTINRGARDNTNQWGWHKWGMFHLDHCQKLICDYGAGELSMAMGQKLLPVVGSVHIVTNGKENAHLIEGDYN